MNGIEYDVVVVGGGMAGLSYATYAAADGFDVAVVAREFGGQIAHSPRFDNVAGVGTVRGNDFVFQAMAQAKAFGADLIGDEVTDIGRRENARDTHAVYLNGQSILRPKVLVLATGCQFQKVELPGLSDVLHHTAFYGGVPQYGDRFEGQDVTIIGGGNAAAQSILYMATIARTVNVLMRGSQPTWSSYLGKEMAQSKGHIHLLPSTVAKEVRRDGSTITNLSVVTDGVEEDLPTDGLFILAGQVPDTRLADVVGVQINMMNQGRIRTGPGLTQQRYEYFLHHFGRKPLICETSKPGIFAIGDCRDGAGHGVAAALGDGNTAASELWKYMQFHHKDRAAEVMSTSVAPVPVGRRP